MAVVSIATAKVRDRRSKFMLYVPIQSWKFKFFSDLEGQDRVPECIGRPLLQHSETVDRENRLVRSGIIIASPPDPSINDADNARRIVQNSISDGPFDA
jgi:hypothetical protein